MKRITSIFFMLAWNDYRIFQGISRYAHQAEWTMDTRHFFLNMRPRDHSFQGMIAMRHSDPAVRAYVRKMAKRVPTVILGTQNPGIEAPMVIVDNRQAGRRAAEHLYGLFHKHYAWFACDSDPSGTERRNAFEGRLHELGFACSDLSCGRSPFNAKKVLHKLKLSPSPLGVMARDDHDASVLIDLCQRAGLRVPENVAVIGVGDLESVCSFSSIPISSINLNWEEVGFQSAAVLDQLMQGKSVPPRTIIPPGPLTQRLSTRCLAIINPHLKEAVKMIDREFKRLLAMDDIAAAAGVSRRQLYLLFQEEMRCSPHDYLMNIRQDHAQQLLTENELSLHEIAHACGFNTPRTLHRAFIQRFGVAPSKWAKQ
jgi:LacI family transcriptional regulator